MLGGGYHSRATLLALAEEWLLVSEVDGTPGSEVNCSLKGGLVFCSLVMPSGNSQLSLVLKDG